MKMGIWGELESLSKDYRDQLFMIYGQKNFSLEIRGLFADWFETRDWNFDETNPDNALKASELLMMLLKLLEDHYQQSQDLINQMRFQSERKRFVEMYGHNAQLFVQTVRGILNEEKQLIARMQMGSVSIKTNEEQQALMQPLGSPMIPVNLTDGLNELTQQIIALDMFFKDYRDRHESFILKHSEFTKAQEEYQKEVARSGNDPQGQVKLKMIQKHVQESEKVLKNLVIQLKQDREVHICQNFLKIVQAIDIYEGKAIEELSSWRIMQQRSLSDGSALAPLDEIQRWFEELTEAICHFDNLASQYNLMVERLPDNSSMSSRQFIQQLQEKMVQTFFNLVRRSFIVEKQPPQTLKTQTKFQASVRLLAGTRYLLMGSTEVSVSILSEKQCKEFVKQEKPFQDIGNCGEIFNDKCVMEQNKDRTFLHADFKNLQLKKIKRQDRKGQESVLEAKSALVFSAKFKINGGACNEISVHTMSVPVVVVVHGNQGPNSEATIIWDNMFSVPGREPFDVPDEVPWKDMEIALNARWKMHADENLHQNHLNYLRQKIFSLADREPPSDTKVPWALFNKEPLKGRSFTFWEWFYGALEVVRKNLKEHWKDNCLEFMSRQEAHERLLQKPPGTFIIRFSDGEIGAVTIAWCYQTMQGFKGTSYLQPWSAKDFSIRMLADRIFDIEQITHLYPDIPKDRVFGRFRTQESNASVNSNAGYVMSGIFTKIIEPLAKGSVADSPYNPNLLEILIKHCPREEEADYLVSKSEIRAFVHRYCSSFVIGDFAQCDADPGSPTESYSVNSPLSDEQLMDALQNFPPNPPNVNTHTAADYFINVQNQEYRDVETLFNNIAPSSMATFNTANMANNSTPNYVTPMSFNPR